MGSKERSKDKSGRWRSGPANVGAPRGEGDTRGLMKTSRGEVDKRVPGNKGGGNDDNGVIT